MFKKSGKGKNESGESMVKDTSEGWITYILLVMNLLSPPRYSTVHQNE
jgi:hypothetical protein